MTTTKPVTWPHCTVTGCTHRRTWPDTDTRRRAVDLYRGQWILPAGRAVCRCHRGGPNDSPVTFPCDESPGVDE